jgi:hypothetical protein
MIAILQCRFRFLGLEAGQILRYGRRRGEGGIRGLAGLGWLILMGLGAVERGGRTRCMLQASGESNFAWTAAGLAIKNGGYDDDDDDEG